MTAILWLMSLVAVVVMTIDQPMTLVAFVAFWWAVFKIGTWLTRERDQKTKAEGRHRRGGGGIF